MINNRFEAGKIINNSVVSDNIKSEVTIC